MSQQSSQSSRNIEESLYWEVYTGKFILGAFFKHRGRNAEKYFGDKTGPTGEEKK